MNPIDASEQRAQRQAEERRDARHRAEQMRRDVQTVFAEPQARRVLAAFIADAGLDLSAYRENPAAMAHAVAWQDAARWWLDLLRAHCPEREAQMRKESREARPTAAQDDATP